MGFAPLGIGLLAGSLISCSPGRASARDPGLASPAREIGVIRVGRKTLQRTLVVSSELVPFQQIDVYAKESGFVRELDVDYGTRVKAGQVMAVLEIPELQMQLAEDDADIKDASGQVARMRDELQRVQAQQTVAHLEFSRLNAVAKSRPGLVAQQEVDDWQGKDLAAQAQVDAATSALESAQSQLAHAQAKQRHDQVLFDYSKITAPFQGVVTQRYANLGTLMQSGTNSSTQALPLVQLSEDNLFRLVIPVAESYVPYVRLGDPVSVRVPALNRSFPGKVARFSVDVQADTRTMHTEVDVPNPDRELVPGLYAEATLVLDRRPDVLAVPQEAVNIEGSMRSVWVVDPSNRMEKRSVAIGLETPNDVQVRSGLREGDLVAVGDRSSLQPGELVRPKIVQLIQSSPQQE
ncbi:MAG TPA: efflux RND transporter periplasmic adaptor subunit [Bryobacteraceae bacterium]|nr:efflux RND transporter periplasmic adaptor subunit [Bryobacteraceae bacterium]